MPACLSRLVQILPLVHPPSHQVRDPIMEEVQNSTFSLKIMVGAGTACAFHVGGNVDEATDSSTPEVPHWEYLLGDRCVKRRGLGFQCAGRWGFRLWEYRYNMTFQGNADEATDSSTPEVRRASGLKSGCTGAMVHNDD